MNKILITIITAVVVIIGIVAVTSNEQMSSKSNAASYSAIQADVKTGAKLYDVRTSQEYDAGHFAGAVNWSLQDMQAGKLPGVDKSTKLYIYCQSGNRSSQATRLLKEAGYTSVIDLGGLQDVQAAGGKLQ
jgi:rhodanese-related sulfurtransferase